MLIGWLRSKSFVYATRYRAYTHVSICPFRTRFGPVPVSVAVPPIFAAYAMLNRIPLPTVSNHFSSSSSSSSVLHLADDCVESLLLKSTNVLRVQTTFQQQCAARWCVQTADNFWYAYSVPGAKLQTNKRTSRKQEEKDGKIEAAKSNDAFNE